MAFRSWTLTVVNLHTSSGVISGTGEVLITDDSRVAITVDIPSLVPPINGHFLVTGDESSGLKLEAQQCLVTNHSFSSSTKFEIKPLRCKLFDSGLVGQAWNEQIFTLKNASFYNSANFSVGGFNCSLSILPQINVQNIMAGDLTAELKITPLSPTVTDLSQMAYDICILITLTQRCPIFFGIREFKSGGMTSEIHLESMNQDYKSISPMINAYANDICSFVQSQWATFKAEQMNYNLNILVDYYWRSHQENYAEIKLVFGSIFMESLKFNWAKNVATNLDIDTKTNGLIRGFKLKPAPTPPAPDRRRHVSFEDLLVMASNAIGYPAIASTSTTPGTFTFIEDRNAVFHTGLSGAHQLGYTNSWPYLKPTIHKLYDQMDELILRILNFSGTVYLHDGRTKVLP